MSDNRKIALDIIDNHNGSCGAVGFRACGHMVAKIEAALNEAEDRGWKASVEQQKEYPDGGTHEVAVD